MLVVMPELQAHCSGIRQEGSKGGESQKKTPESPYLASTSANQIMQTVKLKLVAGQRESHRFYDPTARKEF